MAASLFGFRHLDQAGGVGQFIFQACAPPTATLSSFWRSRISFCAAVGSFQMAGSSALAFSSSRRRSDLSQSKMPPQQGDGLLDVVDAALGFRAHGPDIGCVVPCA